MITMSGRCHERTKKIGADNAEGFGVPSQRAQQECEVFRSLYNLCRR